MGKTIAIVNQKGGVGKTTTTVNLSAYLAAKGRKVLLVDIDPQGNATIGLGINKHAEESNINDVLMGDENIAAVIKKTSVDGLFLAASNVNLAGAEIQLVEMQEREYRLKQALAEIKEDYDYIFIDCPPALGLLTLNSLVAADSVLIPIQCEFYALEGLARLLETVELVKDSLNPDLMIEGALITMFDSRTSLSVQVLEEIKKKFKNRAYDTIIPRNVRLSEAPGFGQTILQYDKGSRGAKAYENLAEEIIKGEKHASKERLVK
ncbi:MAG: ParA family protein [Candidatus Goldbacteria bacterium]|nr:ParA family protein [Candidatus Goldiibacteriota bacterium]